MYMYMICTIMVACVCPCTNLLVHVELADANLDCQIPTANAHFVQSPGSVLLL